MKRALNVFTWTTMQHGQTVRCVDATHSRGEAARLAGLERIEAALEIGQTINPEMVTAALGQVGKALVFDGFQYRRLEAA